MMEPSGGGSCGFRLVLGMGRGVHVAPTPLSSWKRAGVPFITFICEDKKASNFLCCRDLGLELTFMGDQRDLLWQIRERVGTPGSSTYPTLDPQNSHHFLCRRRPAGARKGSPCL